MAERDLLLKEKVKYSGIFDYPGFYRFAHGWFVDERYGVDEDEYTEKVTGNSKELEIKWTAKKDMSDYFKIEHKIKFKIEGMSDVEVEIDGVKKQLNKGQVEVEIKGNLVSDRKSKWDRSPWFRFWRDVYSKYIVPQRVDELEDRTKDDVKKFKEELKAYLELLGSRKGQIYN